MWAFSTIADTRRTEIDNSQAVLDRIQRELRGHPSVEELCSDESDEFRRIRDDSVGSVGQLPPHGMANYGNVYKEQRQRLLGTQQVVDDTDAALENTVRTINETTMVGAETSVTLLSQREALERTRDAVYETDDMLTQV